MNKETKMIRSTLGVYLKNRNYQTADKFRKSDFGVLQTPKQFIFSRMIEEDTSRMNSFLYSNVLCLTNHYHAVEQHFGRFIQFVQNQPDEIKNELSNLFGPIICHIYIELLKGREWKPAYEFLRRHAHLVAPVENLNAPLPSKINGCSVSSNFHNDTTTTTSSSSPSPATPASSSSSYPTATTQILFTNESTGNSIRDYFKEIIRILSTCLKIESLESKEPIGLLRSSKYEIEINLISLNALKRYLEKQGHVIILNILRTWIHFTIRDLKDNNYDDNNEENNSLFVLDEEVKKRSISTTIDKKSNDADDGNIKTETNVNDNSIKITHEEKKTSSNIYLSRLANVVTKLDNIDTPVKTIKIFDPDKNISNVAIDSERCHLVATYQDSTVKLWQLNRNICLGRNLYEKFDNRICEWSIQNESKFMDYDDSDSDDEDWKKRNPLNLKRQENFIARKYEGNSFDDSGSILLRGHTRGVTDCAFSKRFPLLYTTSKDCTMRVWKSKDYFCGGVYRGHNYPVWCLSESPIGTYVATGSRDRTARLWTIERPFPLITYIGHSQDIDCVAFHPNGNYLATASCDLSVRLWSVTSGKLFRVFTDCRFPIICIEFSPDGKYIAAAGEENKIRIFDLAAGSQIYELKDHTSPIQHVIWNSSGNKIASCCLDGSVRIWDITKNDIQQTPSASSSSSTSLSSTSISTSLTAQRTLHYNTTCSRGIKIFYNSNDTVSLIGSTNNVKNIISDATCENLSQ